MDHELVSKNTFNYHDSGFHCAEASFRAIVETVNEAEAKVMTKVASAFLVGIGGTQEELCGALSGCFMAAGYLMGRTEPGIDIQPLKDVVTMLRSRFIERYGTTQCSALLDQFGPQDNSMDCKHLTRELAGDLYRMLQENGYID